MTEEAEFVTIARVAKTQGRHGEVAATLLTDFPELFETRKKLFALGDSKSKAARLSRAGESWSWTSTGSTKAW